MRQGDFSEVGTIYDPLTTVTQPGGTFTRQPFPGNVIPRERWDPVTAQLINAYPRPTTPALANNLVTTPTRTQDWNQFDGRVDHSQSANDSFLGRYSRSQTATTNPYTFPPVQLAGLSKAVGLGNEDTFAGPSELLAEHAVFGWSHVFSPRLLLDSRFGYNHFNLEFTQADVVAGEQLGEQLGVPNANQQDAQAGIPIFSPAGYTGIGHSRSLPILRRERTFQYVSNLTYAADRHTLKAGFDVRRRHMGEFQTNRGNGRFNFASNITNNPANNTGGHVMAAFLLGAPSLIEQDYLLVDAAIRTTEYSAYFSDDWRASSKLTLNLGLRYELDTPATETSNTWANFDPATATVLVAGRNGVDEAAGVRTYTKMFAPRVGFAYHLTPLTVVRGGAGIFWNTPGHGGNALRLHRHVPFGPIYSFNPGNQFVSRRVSDGFPTIPALDVTLADNPSGSVIGVDPELPAGLRPAVQPDGRTRAARIAAAQDLVRGQHRPASRHDLQPESGRAGARRRQQPPAVLRRASDAGRCDLGGIRRHRLVSCPAVQRRETAHARGQWPGVVHLGSFDRHRGPELRWRCRWTLAAGSA